MLFVLRRWFFLEKCCRHLLSELLVAEIIEVCFLLLGTQFAKTHIFF